MKKVGNLTVATSGATDAGAPPSFSALVATSGAADGRIAVATTARAV